MIAFKKWLENIDVAPGNIRDTIISTGKQWGGTPQQINDGDCQRFAKKVVGMLGVPNNVTKVVSIQGLGSNDHSWIMHQNRHYDVENPDGVDDPKELKFFVRNSDIPRNFKYFVDKTQFK